MLSNIDIKNIRNFENLKVNHQRVLRWKLRKKCTKLLYHLEYLLLNHDKLKIKPNEIIDTEQLKKVIDLYENTQKL